MNINLAVAIAAHRARDGQVAALRKDLGFGRPVFIAWDQGNGEWDTHSRAWLSCLEQHSGTHGLLLEDDAVVCPDLIPAVEAGIGRFPDSALSLYFGRHENPYNRSSRIRGAREAAKQASEQDNVSWIATRGLWWGVAVVLPLSWVEPMLAYWRGRKTGLYDERITKWLIMANRGTVYNTWPSLVDHRDEGSLLRPSRRPGRRAFRVVESGSNWDPSGAVMSAWR